jgi:hypothetical protein
MAKIMAVTTCSPPKLFVQQPFPFPMIGVVDFNRLPPASRRSYLAPRLIQQILLSFFGIQG